MPATDYDYTQGPGMSMPMQNATGFPDMSSLPPISPEVMKKLMGMLNGTIGAALLGGIAAAIFLGISMVQGFLFYRLRHPDGVAFRMLIFGLCLLDVLHAAFITHALYYYLVLHFMDLGQIFHIELVWSVYAQLVVTTITTLMVRLIFMGRIYHVSHGSPWCTIPLIFLDLTTFAGSITFMIQGLQASSWMNWNWQEMLYATFIVAAVADMATALVMGILLARQKTGFEKTDHTLKRCISFCVRVGVLTVVSSLAVLISYAVARMKMVYIAFFFVINPLFLNALLISLNWRDGRMDPPKPLEDGLAKQIAWRPATPAGNRGSRLSDQDDLLELQHEGTVIKRESLSFADEKHQAEVDHVSDAAVNAYILRQSVRFINPWVGNMIPAPGGVRPSVSYSTRSRFSSL